MASGEEQDYVLQLQEVFNSCDASGTGTLSRLELEDLCERLQLADQADSLIDQLLHGDPQARVDFDHFKEGFVAALSEAVDSSDGEDDDDDDDDDIHEASPQLSPKFVKGEKKYGRRSRPETDTEGDGGSDTDYSYGTSPRITPRSGHRELSLRLGSLEQELVEAEEKLEDEARQSATPSPKNQSPKTSPKSLSNKSTPDKNGKPHRKTSETFEAEGQMAGSMADIEGSTEAHHMHLIWQELGVGREGYLTMEELASVCERIGMEEMNQEELHHLFDKLDVDADGRVSFNEFLQGLFQYGGPSVSTTPTPQRQLSTPRQKLRMSLGGQLDENRQTPSLVSAGAGLFSALDTDNTGFVKPDVIIELWDSFGIPQGAEILEYLQFNLTQKINLMDLSCALEQELRTVEEDNATYQAAVATYEYELRYLKSNTEHLTGERNKLKTDLQESTNRIALLVKEGDDRYTSLERSKDKEIRSLEDYYQEQIKLLQSEIESERETLNHQSSHLRQKMETEIVQLKDDEQKMKDKLSRTQKDLEKLEKEVLDMAEKCTDLERQNLRQQRELEATSELHLKLEEMESNRDIILGEQQKFSEQKLTQLQGENQELKDKTDEMTAEIEELNQRVSQQRRHKRSARAQERKRAGSDLSQYAKAGMQGQASGSDDASGEDSALERPRRRLRRRPSEDQSEGEQMSVLTIKLQDEVEQLKRERDVLVDQHKQDIGSLEATHEETLKILWAKHDDKIDELSSKHEEHIKELETELEDKVKRLSTKHENQLQKLEEEYKEKLQRTESEHKDYIETLEKNHEENLLLLQVNNDKATKSIQEQHEEFIKSLKETHVKTIESLNNSHQEAGKSLYSKHEEDSKTLQAKLDEKVDSVSKKYEEDILLLQAKHEEATKSLQNQHDEEIESLKHHHTEEMESMQTQHKEEVTDLKQQIVTVSSEHLSSSEELQRLHRGFSVERKDIEDAFKMEIAQMEDRHIQEKNELLKKLNTEKDELETEFQTVLEDNLKEQEEKLRQEFDQQKEDWLIKVESEKNLIKHEHQQELNKLEEELSNRMEEKNSTESELVANLRKQKAEAELQLKLQEEELQMKFEKEKMNLAEKYDEEKASISERHRNDIYDLENSLAKGTDGLQGQLKTDFYSLLDQHKFQQQNELQAAFQHDLDLEKAKVREELEHEKLQISSQMEKEKQSLEKELENERSNLLGSLDKDRSELQQNFNKDKQEWQQLMEQQREQLLRDFNNGKQQTNLENEKALKEKDEKINILQDEIEKLTAEISELTEKTNLAEAEKLRNDEEIDELRDSLAKLTKEKNQAEHEKEFKDQEMSDVLSDMSALDEEKRRLERDLTDKNQEIRDLGEAVAKLETEKQQAEQEIREQELNQTSLELEREVLRKDLREELEGDIERRLEDEFLQQMDLLKSAFAEEREQLQSSIRLLQEEIDHLNSQGQEDSLQRQTESETRLRDLQSRLRDTESRLQASRDVEQKQQDSMDDLRRTNNNLRAEKDKDEQEKAKLQRELDDKVHRLTMEREDAISANHMRSLQAAQSPTKELDKADILRELEGQRRLLEDKTDRLQRQIETMNRGKDNLTPLKLSHDRLVEEKHAMEKTIQENEDKIRNLLDQALAAERLKAQLHNNDVEKDALKNRLEMTADKLADVSTALSLSNSEHQREQQALREKLGHMVDKEKYNALNGKLAEAQKRVGELEAALEKRAAETTKVLMGTQNDHQRAVEELEGAVDSAEQRAAHAQKLLDEQVERLKSQLQNSSKVDLLVKDLYVENAHLMKCLQVTEQREKDAERKVYNLEEKCRGFHRLVQKLAPLAIG